MILVRMEEVADIRNRNRPIVAIVGISIALLAVVILLANLSWPAKQTEVLPAPEDSWVEAPPVPSEPSHAEPILRFDTDPAEPYVIWRQDSEALYVQNLRLVYTTDGEEERVLHEWKKPLSAQAWRNGDLVLIGTQLIDGNSDEEGYRGQWLALRIAPEPKVVAEENIYFGPQEVMTAKYAEQPRMFYAAVRNGERFSEYVFDPAAIGEWIRIRYELSAEPWQPPEMPVQSDSLERFEFKHVLPMPNGEAVYAYHDDTGSFIYYKERDLYPYFGRTSGYTLEDAKWIPFVDDAPQVLGKLRDSAGGHVMAFLGHGDPLPLESKLWEGDWQALNDRVFVRALSENLEVVQYPDPNITDDRTPHAASFSTKGWQWVSSEGSLATYEANGGKRYISYYDLANSVEAAPESIWLSSLLDYKVKQEERVNEAVRYDMHMIPEWDYPGDNTNSEIPDALREAVSEVHMDGDYGFARTYRKFGDRWFVLVDRHFYEFKDGRLSAIGDMPVTIMVRVGEASGGQGPMDFALVGDDWFVADTEASRVLKLNDRLEVQAELEVPNPYKLTIRDERVEIATTSEHWTANLALELLNKGPLPYVSTAKMKKQPIEQFWQQQWYKDSQSGLAWYYLQGWLYQYLDQEQVYRSFFIGFNENDMAQVRILPYRDEVLVLLDRRLERFDRAGNRLGAIEFPRSRPDGIYDRTPQGENSMYLDAESERLILVQGYRVLEIDLASGETRTIFRQNYADIGELIPHDGGHSLYFLLSGNENYRYIRREREDRAAGVNMYSEVVRIDLRGGHVQRFVVDGYYDKLRLEDNAAGGDSPSFVLLNFT